MKKIKHDLGLRIAKLLPILLAGVPFAILWYSYFADTIAMPYYNRGDWMVIGLFVVLYIIFARIYDAFVISLYRISELIYSQCLAVFVSDCVIFVVIWLLNHEFPNLIPCFITLAVQGAGLIGWSFGAHIWYYASFPPAVTTVVYDRRYHVDSLLKEYHLEKKFDVQRTINVEACLDEIEILDTSEVVFVCGVQSHERNIIVKHCLDRGICVYVLPRIGDILMSGAKRLHMFHMPMLRVERWNPNPDYKFAKRLLDIVLSAVVLLVFSPVMIVTAIAIKATDGGPVFYKQRRLTKDGKVFNVLKFRSMRVDAEKDGVARLSTGEKDDRITPVGRIIRKFRIDELPQLLNILSGDMSVVGPRPERPEIAEQYEKELPEFRLRLQVKAGLTGYAQVYGKYNTPPYEKLQMDLMYISNPSFWEDIKIVFATIKIIFIPESTDGIAEGQTTAAQKEEEKTLQEVGK